MRERFLKMKRAALIFCIVLLIGGMSVSAFASGGKHRGERGKGRVIQHQIRNNP
jgi:hypothetical protein